MLTFRQVWGVFQFHASEFPVSPIPPKLKYILYMYFLHHLVKASALRWSWREHYALSRGRTTGQAGLFQEGWVEPKGVGCRAHIPLTANGPPGRGSNWVSKGRKRQILLGMPGLQDVTAYSRKTSTHTPLDQTQPTSYLSKLPPPHPPKKHQTKTLPRN